MAIRNEKKDIVDPSHDNKILVKDAENTVLDQWDELPVPAQNIARIYEAFRKGEWVPGFEWAVERHEMLEEIWRRFDEKQAPGKTS
jgi:hypothetical protein